MTIVCGYWDVFSAEKNNIKENQVKNQHEYLSMWTKLKLQPTLTWIYCAEQLADFGSTFMLSESLLYGDIDYVISCFHFIAEIKTPERRHYWRNPLNVSASADGRSSRLHIKLFWGNIIAVHFKIGLSGKIQQLRWFLQKWECTDYPAGGWFWTWVVTGQRGT